MIDPKLLEIMACPLCRGKLKLLGERLQCQGQGCGLIYPIEESIPVMLIERAELPPGIASLEQLPAYKAAQTKYSS